MTLIIRLPGLGVTEIAVISSAIELAVLENTVVQGLGTGGYRSNRGGSIFIVIVAELLR